MDVGTVLIISALRKGEHVHLAIRVRGPLTAIGPHPRNPPMAPIQDECRWRRARTRLIHVYLLSPGGEDLNVDVLSWAERWSNLGSVSLRLRSRALNARWSPMSEDQPNKQAHKWDKSTAGGSAMHAGANFQNRVAAWIAVRILAEVDATPYWDLPAATVLQSIRCETEQPIDDLLVGTSEGGRLFTQAKHTVTLRPVPKSELGVTIDQFVRQYLALQHQPGERLDLCRDRFVLIVGPGTSRRVTHGIPDTLKRLRTGAVLNREQAHIWSVIRKHIESSWTRLRGSGPTEDEVANLLTVMTVHALDVSENGRDAFEAKDLLRRSLLHQPNQADQAWNSLINLFAALSAGRGGVTRAALQRALQDTGIALRTVRSYSEDVRRLQAYSQRTLADLSALSKLRIGEHELRLSRQCERALRQHAEHRSVLVVGDPGAGKSGALHAVVSELHEEGRDVVFLAVDHLDVTSHGHIREDLGLEHNLEEVLENWLGNGTAFLVIDALDAARAERSAQTLRAVLSRVIRSNSRWKVIACIRKFDLRYSHDLRQLFAGPPPDQTFLDAEFSSVSHIHVPIFSLEELHQVVSTSHILTNLVATADENLLTLLRVPFNLRLVGELVGEGVPLAELTPLRTQLELLDRYWAYRVIRADGGRDARESLLRRALDKMIQTRLLRVPRIDIINANLSDAVHDLLSVYVLTEWQRCPSMASDGTVLAFSHHVLFDYAAERLLWRGDPFAAVNLFASHPDLIMMLRPSLLMHCHHAWLLDDSKREFWELVFRFIERSGIPEVARLVGPALAAEASTRAEDFSPCIDALTSPEQRRRTNAETAWRHVVGALLAIPPAKLRERVGGPNAGPWTKLLRTITDQMTPQIAYSTRSLLISICEEPEILTPVQLAEAGVVARRLLSFSRQQQDRDQWLGIHALQCVCRTFDSDSIASTELLRQSLDPDRLAACGYWELPWLAREVEPLIVRAAPLVAEIYMAAFGYEESSQDQTPLGSGSILPLVSSRSQDYRLALYSLAEAFPKLVAASPVEATRALISVVESYVKLHHSLSGETVEQSFRFRRRQAYLRTDLSCIWDAGSHLDEPQRMLDAFFCYCDEIAQSSETNQLLRDIVQLFVANARTAGLWSRLLKSAAKAPRTLGLAVRPLAWSLPVLTCIDTITAAGEFLASIFAHLTPTECARVERAILSIPHAVPKERFAAGEMIRDRLLGCLPREHLTGRAAATLIDAMAGRFGPPPNSPPFEIGHVQSEPYGERQYLAVQQVPVDEPPNVRMQVLEKPVDEFSHKYLNEVPTQAAVSATMPDIRTLAGALATATTDGVHPLQQDHAWGVLTSACARVAKCPYSTCDSEVWHLIRHLLLTAADSAVPPVRPEEEGQFDAAPHWGIPAPRVDAAAGLMHLAEHKEVLTDEVEGTIDRLVRDPVAAVRYQIVARLSLLSSSASDFMWHLVEAVAHHDTSKGVLHALVATTLVELVGQYPARVLGLTNDVFARTTPSEEADPVRLACVDIFTYFYLWRESTLARDTLSTLTGRTDEHFNENQHILFVTRGLLSVGAIKGGRSGIELARKRAWELLKRIIDDAIVRLRDYRTGLRGATVIAPELQQRVRRLAELLDSASMHLYAASGALDDKKSHNKPLGNVPSDNDKRKFLEDSRAVLDTLCRAGIPSVTHHLVELLAYLAQVDPPNVFLRIGQIVKGAEDVGYQYESLAANAIVALVERYLAEFRAIFQESKDCRLTLLELLDIFVDAGWPAARRLTYRMEEIFR